MNTSGPYLTTDLAHVARRWGSSFDDPHVRHRERATFAATAALYTRGLYATPDPTNGGSDIVSQPGGGIYHGTHFWWLADGISGFVRLDPDPLNPALSTAITSGPGKVNGSVSVDFTDMQSMVNTALSNPTTVAALTPTQLFSNGITSAMTITGNGGPNVIKVVGDITNAVTLSGSASGIFIINVSGNLSLTGSTSRGLSGGVAVAHVPYNRRWW